MTTLIDHTSAPATTPGAHDAATPWPAVLTVAAGAIVSMSLFGISAGDRRGVPENGPAPNRREGG